LSNEDQSSDNVFCPRRRDRDGASPRTQTAGKTGRSGDCTEVQGNLGTGTVQQGRQPECGCVRRTETCWAVGDKSTILFTNDGGTNWQVQLGGDPDATDDDLSKVFFLNAKNGWAMTNRGKVLGTTDGSTWAELSTVSGTSQGV
jgi:hypothetical protein